MTDQDPAERPESDAPPTWGDVGAQAARWGDVKAQAATWVDAERAGAKADAGEGR